MIHAIVMVFEVCAVAGTVAGISYYVLCLLAAGSYLAQRRVLIAAQPVSRFPVSILKPLKGVDPEIYESFRTHCLQDHPSYEIIFGVSKKDDPAVEAVVRLQKEFPQCAIQLVVCPQRLGTNMKVSNLAQMLRVAHHEYLIVNDSDIRVQSDYLRRVTAPLADEKVGMVTCLYRGIATSTLVSHLEALGISTDFTAGVLVARLIEGGIHFGLGSTLAFRRKDLEALGGFEAFVDYLADDYELGKSMAARGFQVQLSEVAVETVLPAYDVRGFIEHQLRWARSVRDSRRGGYFGLLLTFGLPWAALAMLLSRCAPWAWWLAAIAFVFRILMAWVVGRIVLDDRNLASSLPLIPIRDCIALLLWLCSFGSDAVSWRGDKFTLKDGKLERVEPS